MEGDSTDEGDILEDILNDGDDFAHYVNKEFPDESLDGARRLSGRGKHGCREADSEKRSKKKSAKVNDHHKNTSGRGPSVTSQDLRRSEEQNNGPPVVGVEKRLRQTDVMKVDRGPRSSYIQKGFARPGNSYFPNHYAKCEEPTSFEETIGKTSVSDNSENFNKYGGTKFRGGFSRSAHFNLRRGYGRSRNSYSGRGFGRREDFTSERSFGSSINLNSGRGFGRSGHNSFGRGFGKSRDFGPEEGFAEDFPGSENSYRTRDYERPMEFRDSRRHDNSRFFREFGEPREAFDGDFRKHGSNHRDIISKGLKRPGEMLDAVNVKRLEGMNAVMGNKRRDESNDRQVSNKDADRSVTKNHKRLRDTKCGEKHLNLETEGKSYSSLNTITVNQSASPSKALIADQTENLMETSVENIEESGIPTFRKNTEDVTSASKKHTKDVDPLYTKHTDEMNMSAIATDPEHTTREPRSEKCFETNSQFTNDSEEIEESTAKEKTLKSVVQTCPERLKSVVTKCPEKSHKSVVQRCPEKSVKSSVNKPSEKTLKSVIKKCNVSHDKSNASDTASKSLKSFVGKVINRPEKVSATKSRRRPRDVENTAEKEAHSTNHGKKEYRSEKRSSSRAYKSSAGPYKYNANEERCYKRSSRGRASFHRNVQDFRSPYHTAGSDSKVLDHSSKRDHSSKTNMDSRRDVEENKHSESRPAKIQYSTEHNSSDIEKNHVREKAVPDKKQSDGVSSNCDPKLFEEATQRPPKHLNNKYDHVEKSGKQIVLEKFLESQQMSVSHSTNINLLEIELPKARPKDRVISEKWQCDSKTSKCDAELSKEKTHKPNKLQMKKGIRKEKSGKQMALDKLVESQQMSSNYTDKNVLEFQLQKARLKNRAIPKKRRRDSGTSDCGLELPRTKAQKSDKHQTKKLVHGNISGGQVAVKKQQERKAVTVSNPSDEGSSEIESHNYPISKRVITDKNQCDGKLSKYGSDLAEEKSQRAFNKRTKEDDSAEKSGTVYNPVEHFKSSIIKFSLIEDDLLDYELPEFPESLKTSEKVSSDEQSCGFVGGTAEKSNNKQSTGGFEVGEPDDDLLDYELPEYPIGENTSSEIQLKLNSPTMLTEVRQDEPINQQNDEGANKKKSDDDQLDFELLEFPIGESSSNGIQSIAQLKPNSPTMLTKVKQEEPINQQNEEGVNEKKSDDDLLDYELPEFPIGESTSNEIQSTAQSKSSSPTLFTEVKQEEPIKQLNEEGVGKKTSDNHLLNYKLPEFPIGASTTNEVRSIAQSKSLSPTMLIKLKQEEQIIEQNEEATSRKNPGSKLASKANGKDSKINQTYTIDDDLVEYDLPDFPKNGVYIETRTIRRVFFRNPNLASVKKEQQLINQQNEEKCAEKSGTNTTAVKCHKSEIDHLDRVNETISLNNQLQNDIHVDDSLSKESGYNSQLPQGVKREKEREAQNEQEACKQNSADNEGIQENPDMIVNLDDDKIKENPMESKYIPQDIEDVELIPSDVQFSCISVNVINDEEGHEGEVKVITLGHENLHVGQQEVVKHEPVHPEGRHLSNNDPLQPEEENNINNETVHPGPSGHANIQPVSLRGTQSPGEYTCKLNHMCRSAKYFLVRTAYESNVEISKRCGFWVTTQRTADRLNRAFDRVYNVIIIVVAENSQQIAGFARLSGEYNLESVPEWRFSRDVEDDPVPIFEIDWLCRLPLPFREVMDLYNVFNPNEEKIYLCEDGEELEPLAVRELFRKFPYDQSIQMENILKKARRLAATRQRLAACLGGDFQRRLQRGFSRFRLARVRMVSP